MATTTRSRYLALAFALSLAFAFLPAAAQPAAQAQSPNPTFTVDPVTDGAWGGEFEPNATITLSRGAESCTTTADDLGTFGFDLANCGGGGSLDLNAGETVEVTDGTTTKSHTITDLRVTAVDDLANTVTGTASGSDVNVWVHEDGTPGVITFVGTTWTADFDGSFDIVPGTNGAAREPDEDGDSTNADWWVPNPRIYVESDTENIWGNEFASDATVDVTVSRDGADLHSSSLPTDEWGNFGTSNPLPIDIQPGDVVSADDGTTTKMATVTDVAVTDLNTTTEIISGTASDGADVCLDMWVPEWGWGNDCTTPSGGAWSIATNTPAFDSFGLEAGSYGSASQCDAESDCTWISWWVPDPRVNVDPNSEGLWGNDFVPNGSVTVTVTRAGAPLSVPGSPFATDEWGNFATGFEPSQLDLQAGDEVTASDGVSPKGHTITDLTVDVVNHDTNIVSGTAAPGSEVWVDLHGWWGVGRSVTADPSGSWSTDFDDPGNEGQTADFGPGENGSSSQCDADNDCTQIDWHAPNPRIDVDPASDNVWGNDFTPDDFVSITIGASTFGPYPTDRWGNFGTDQSLPVDITTGDTVTVFDATSSVGHTVLLLEVTSVDPGVDVVTGTTGAESRVDVWVHDVGDVNRTASADVSGHWEVDFTAGGISDPNDQGTADLEPGSNGNSNTCDAAGNCTYASWHVSDPRITASVIHEEVWANDFPDDPEGQTLYYRLDDPATPAIEFESDMPLIVNQGGTEAGDRSFGRYDVQAGQIFTVRNRPFGEPLGGGMERVLDISHIEVTGVDGDLDTISGYADTAEGDYVCVWSQDAQLCSDQFGFTWNFDGTWVADFAAIGSDVRPGQWNSASQYEADGDETHHWWNLPPWVVVELAPEDESGAPLWADKVRAEAWTGPVVTLAINGGDVEQWTVTGDGHYTFDPGIDIEPGDVVTLSDANDSKTIIVEPLTIDQINFAGDTPPNTVFGTASPNRNVRVDASATIGGWWAERWVDAAASGDFSADFGTPGNGWREQWTADFGGAEGLGRNMRVELYDDDNDRVETFTCQGVPRIEVMRSDGRVEAYDFPAGHTVTLAITGEAGTYEAIAQLDQDNPCQTIAPFELGFEIPSGATVTATSTDPETGEITGTTTHTVIEFTIDGADPASDTVFGTATPGQRVLVEADGNNWRYVTAVDDGSGVGVWTADFSVQGPDPGEEQIVDLGPGSSGRALIIDQSGNTTDLTWRISAAHFQVDPTSEMLWANEFLPNTELLVTVNGTDVPGSPFFTDDWGNFDTSQVEWDPNNPRSFEAGDLVVVTDGETTKEHPITSLTVDPIDPLTDVVSGTAEPGTQIWVDVHDGAGDTGRAVTADGSGQWSTNMLTEPGDGGGTWDLEQGTNGYAQQCDVDNDCTQIQWRIASPSFWADATDDRISGLDFEPGSSVHVKVNDLVLEGSPFAADGQGSFDSDSLDIDLQIGDFVEVNDGTSFKEHFVTALTVLGADAESDTVWGTATANAEVQILAGGSGFDWRRATADTDGNWTAYFGLPGTDPGFENLRDLVLGDNGLALECDDDDDCTNDGWDLRLAQFQIDPRQGGLWANGFAPDAPITVSTGDLVANGGEEIPGSPFWSDGDGNLGTGWDPNEFPLEPDDHVFVTDGATTKDHVITGLSVDSIDPETNVVSGTAAPNSDVWVDIHGHWEAGRTVTADGLGAWETDFDEPGQEGDTHNLEPGTNGYAQQCDADNDCTQISWQVANPTFTIRTGQQLVQGWGWPEGALVTLNIDDPDNGPGVDYAQSQVVGQAEWDPSQTYVEFRLRDEPAFEVFPGFEMEMTDFSTTKSHVVVDVQITAIDLDLDIVRGTASPDSWVNVHIHGTEIARDLLTDGDGTFAADFGNPGDEEHEQEIWDIDFGTSGEVHVGDADGDSTQIDWDVPEPPRFTVNAENDYVSGEGWFGGEIIVTFDNDDVPGGELHALTIADYDQEGRYFEYWLGGEFDIEPNQFVTVTDGERAKTHWVTALTVTVTDEAADTVSGTAAAGSEVHVEVADGVIVGATADASGDWTAEFGGIHDIQPGSQGSAYQPDDDDDRTQVEWRVAGLPEFGISATHDWIEGYDFEGEMITFTIDANDDPSDGVLHEEEIGIDPNGFSWFHFIDGFDVEVGQFVTVTDGFTTKDTRVSPIDITAVDVDNWTVSGIADPGVVIDTFGFHPEVGGFGGFMVQVDGPDPDTTDELEAGSWTLNLDDVFDPNDRPETIPDGMVLGGGQRDVDSDRTIIFWDPAVVEGHVYVDGEPVASAEVFFQSTFGSQHTCTDAEGNYRFDNASVVRALVSEGIAATGRAVSPEAGCTNRDFLDANGLPLATAIEFGPFDLQDGYEYIGFDVLRAAAYQTVVVEDFESEPADGVPVRVFDLDDAEFVAEFVDELGAIDPERYGEIWESGIGEFVFDFTGAYLEENAGAVEMRYPHLPGAGVLILANLDGAIYGEVVLAAAFTPDGTDVLVGPTVVFRPEPEGGPFIQVYSTTAVPPFTDVVFGQDFGPDATLTINGTPFSGFTLEDGAGVGFFVGASGIDIEPGDVVVVSDDDNEVTHVVTPLAVTEIDAVEHTIGGTARANHTIALNMVVNPLSDEGSAPIDIEIPIGGDGLWKVDLDDYVDFGPNGFAGSHGNIYDTDLDNPAQTTLDWWTEPAIAAINTPGGFGDRSEGSLYGDGWILGEFIDVAVTTAEGEEVYASSVPVGYDCDDTAPCRSQGGWSITADELGIALEPGMTIAASQWSDFFPEELGPVGWERTIVVLDASLVGPMDPIPEALEIIATGTFGDDRAHHLVTIDWGDGGGPEAVSDVDYIATDDGFYEATVTPEHAYTTPGVYRVTLTVDDLHGEIVTAEYHYVVVYDPDGKQIVISTEWEQGDVEEEFGANLKFKKDGEPKGSLSFEYEDDGSDLEFEFEATSIDYLLIFGDWGMAGGHGTFDDDCDDDDDDEGYDEACYGGDYEYLLTALDQTKDGGIDAYRIKIWVAGDPTIVVYDTQPGASDFAMPTREPDEGKIKVK